MQKTGSKILMHVLKYAMGFNIDISKFSVLCSHSQESKYPR